jgi:hypothetical protein
MHLFLALYRLFEDQKRKQRGLPVTMSHVCNDMDLSWPWHESSPSWLATTIEAMKNAEDSRQIKAM